MNTSATARRVTTPYDATSTAADVLAGVDLSGRRAVVTGGASGIGVETARALAGAGAAVTLAVRDVDAGARTAAGIAAATGNADVQAAHLDLADRASVASFVASWDGPLHVLVNNAGMMESPELRSPEGWELQFATNHLGHVALATGLHRALAVAGGARVVAVSSSAHLRSPVVFEDIDFRARAYDPWLAYGQSKTANILFAVEAAQRWADDGITVNALHPGGIRTNLQRYVSDEELARIRAAMGDSAQAAPSWKTVEQGAATSVLLAASPLVSGATGRYFEDCNEAPPNVPGSRAGVAAYALDPEAAGRLWALSLQKLG
ncbi:SDR family NAD(P)-dependent oxidoreductase [Motilibacter aurantiacus]|uniref:SDR family NAD(P)-dependent oxidoreductase n=1 Tax=Motilibacter aurantiacus TaxID=2714955 RepID=UPI00140B38C2|nr:SDR family NAD(P)-dependent oxidoreductase [Motilibacter aurantiacus]NHC45700.1 SDR family NAD(P)-dependent oxidoreductase [Motilibacter aurantiacus]